MPTFTVTVTRDASVTFEAEVEEESLEAAQAKMSRHGYACDDSIQWERIETVTFDECEHADISEQHGEVLAEWERDTGWRKAQ